MSLETRFGFCIKMCIDNVFGLRIIDFQLLWSLDFRRKFFYPFNEIGLIYYELFQGEIINAMAEKRLKLANWRGHHDNNRIDCKKKALTVWLGRSIASFILPRSCSIRICNRMCILSVILNNKQDRLNLCIKFLPPAFYFLK